jgi:superfamily II DNA or RNA helicase
VIYAKSPALLELFSRELARCGVESVLYHGEITQGRRRTDIQRFRHGSVNVLLATFGVTRAGLDLYQASHAIFASRLWSETQEDQAVYRLLRPQQTRQVVVEKPHLRGGIDIYQAQLCAWKASAANAGLDWAAPMGEDVEFLHLDQVLGQFVEDLAKMHGMSTCDFRESLKEAA